MPISGNLEVKVIFRRSSNYESGILPTLFIVLTVLAGLWVFLGSETSRQAEAQSDAKSHKFTKIDLGNEPVEITGIETRFGKVTIGEAFKGNGNWLDGLTIIIKNTSDRTITYIDLNIGLRTADGEPFAAGDSFIFGIHPLTKSPPTEAGKLAPGQSTELKLSPTSIASIQRILRDKHSLDDLSVAQLTLMFVSFDDGARWSSGKYRVPDPSSPSGFATEKDQ